MEVIMRATTMLGIRLIITLGVGGDKGSGLVPYPM